MKRINFLKVLTFVMSVLPVVIEQIERAREHFKESDNTGNDVAGRNIPARPHAVTPQSTKQTR